MTDSTLTLGIAEELAKVIGALLDAPGSIVEAPDAAPSELIVRLLMAGQRSGAVTVGFDQAAAASLASQIMTLEETPSHEMISDALREVCGQAIGPLVQRAGFEGMRLAESRVVRTQPGGQASYYSISAGDKFRATVSIWASLDIVESAAPAQEPLKAAPPNLDIILDIDLPLSVRFGETEMTLHALTRLAPGSVIDLGRSPDDPVDVLVNGRLMARGEVVVVAGNYGVRITEVMSAADRLRTVTG